MSLLQRSLAARRWDGVAVCLLYGALIIRFEATRPVTGPHSISGGRRRSTGGD